MAYSLKKQTLFNGDIVKNSALPLYVWGNCNNYMQTLFQNCTPKVIKILIRFLWFFPVRPKESRKYCFSLYALVNFPAGGNVRKFCIGGSSWGWWYLALELQREAWAPCRVLCLSGLCPLEISGRLLFPQARRIYGTKFAELYGTTRDCKYTPFVVNCGVCASWILIPIVGLCSCSSPHLIDMKVTLTHKDYMRHLIQVGASILYGARGNV